MKNLPFVLLVLLFFTSCECYQFANGMIYDKVTNEPIEGASIYIKSKSNSKILSDSNGKFRISNFSGGVFGCPDVQLVIKNKLYKTQEVKIPSGGIKTIYLSK